MIVSIVVLSFPLCPFIRTQPPPPTPPVVVMCMPKLEYFGKSGKSGSKGSKGSGSGSGKSVYQFLILKVLICPSRERIKKV